MHKHITGKFLISAIIFSGLLFLITSVALATAELRYPSSLNNDGQSGLQSVVSQLDSSGTSTTVATTDSFKGLHLVALVAINVRIGPGLNFPVIGLLPAEAEAEIIERSSDQQWWQIVCPLTINAPECWVTTDPLYAQVLDRTAVALILPTATPTAPLSTNVPSPTRIATLLPSPTFTATGEKSVTPTPIFTDTSTREEALTPTLTHTPTRLQEITPPPSIATLTPTATEEPVTPTLTDIPTREATLTPTETKDSATPTLTDTPRDTLVPTASSTPTFTPTPTFTEMSTFTPTPTSTFTPSSPAITLKKFTNGVDANDVPGPELQAGDNVTWEYIVTNIGNSTLNNVVVTDDQGVTVACPKTTLTIGESMTCKATGIATEGQYVNIGTATAETSAGVQVTASDPSHYLGIPATVQAALAGCLISADPALLSEGQLTTLKVRTLDVLALSIYSGEILITEISPVPTMVDYAFVPSASLFDENDRAVINVVARRADNTVQTCQLILMRTQIPDQAVKIVALHGKPGYTNEEVMRSYGITYIPPYVVTEGYQTLQAHLAEMVLHQDRSVELAGGQHLVSLPFQVNADGSVDEISFTIPQGNIILLQVGDAEGRHFDTSRYIPVPFKVDDGHVEVKAYRNPGGIWYFTMDGELDLVRSQDLIFMSEVASQHLAREIGGTVMENNIGRALAVQNRFSLWQRSDVVYPDGPWASQYMAAQCGHLMRYDRNVIPSFVEVTGTNQFTDLRTEEIFAKSLYSFPPPPNKQDKFGAWYCAQVQQRWQPPVP